jgi:alkanesulfonate monooxygenase SsuD/methylene tetrahydromethanopterin reductase-like flavin-dependent oxidoreductase (luciferase family)
VTRPLRVGVQLPEVEWESRWSDHAAMARTAEEVGFDSIWLGDHHLYRDEGRESGPWEAWTLLSAMAAVTRRVAVGPLVACTAFHPPPVLAKMAVTVHEVSGGRLILGLGAGWNEAEFRAFGLAFDHRASRFEEAFEIIRRLLAGERVTVHGRFHQVEDAVLVPRPHRRPTLMVGTEGDRLLRFTLPHADAWNTWFESYGNTVDGFEALNHRISALAEDVGRPAGEVERSACVLVAMEPYAPPRRMEVPVRPVGGGARRVAEHLGSLADAGADEAILVLTPITERSIRAAGETLALLDG